MRRFVLALAVLTAGCGSHAVLKSAEALRAYDVEEPPPPAEVMPPPAVVDGAAQASSPVAPQIAYTYTLGYRLGADRVGTVQQRHVALCDKLGAARCHIVAMNRSSAAEGGTQASLSLVVEARLARAFEDRLDAVAAGAGGSVSSRGVEAEDLSKKIVDTAAKVRGKEALTQRLLALLAKRDGKVGELVEAERAYAQAQEELDAARSWLAEMRGRVAMSKIDIRYESPAAAVGSAWKPVREAFAGAGEALGGSLARLLTFLLTALPWALALALLVWLLRRRGWRPRLPRLPRLQRRAA
jgi:hypothetical protein